MEPISRDALPSLDLAFMTERQKELTREAILAEERLKATQLEIERNLAASNNLKNQVTRFSERQKVYMTAIIVSSVFAGAFVVMSYYK